MKKSIFLFFAAILCAIGMNAYGATQRYIYVGLSNNYHQWKDGSQWGINHWGGTGGGVVSGSKITDLETTFTHSGCTFHMYRMYVYDDNKNFEFKGNDGWWDCKKENISISGTTKNALLFRDDADGGSPTFYQTNYQEESAVSLSASSNSVSVGEEVALTPTLTSNAEYNEVKSTTYSVGAGATISDGKFVATEAGTYTVTATVTYNAQGYTNITKTATATATIIVASAAEPKHDVKVTWMSGETELQSSQTLSVGESTGYPVEAPEFKDYTFSDWTLGTGVQSEDDTKNPIQITTLASGEYTLVANYDYIEPVIKTIYCKMEYDWWTQAGAAISAFISGSYGESATSLGTLMTLAPLEGNVWKIDVDVARYQKIRFIRVNSEGTSDWGARTGLVEIPTDDKNLYTITQSTAEWSGDCPGTWSVYEAPATAPKRYITGTKELVGGEGWKANEIEMSYDNGTSTYSHTFLASTLTADTEYKLKVTEGNWDGGKWGTINGTIPGVSNDGDGNVCFTLKTAGDVTITFDGAKITVSTTGEFKVPVVYPYYILGTMNSWSVKEEYGLADEDADGVYTREITLAAGEHFFKINIGKWDSQWGWSNVVGAYTEATDASDENKIKITLTSEKTFVVEFNKSKNQITFDGLTINTTSLTYTVEVPDGTEKCYIAGDMTTEWSFVEMSKVDDTHFTITIEGATADDKYKYAAGPAWTYVEKKADGSEAEDRTYNANDVVAKWASVYDPSATYVLMGVNGDWDNGIALEVNPHNAAEYRLLCQPIVKANDAIKVVKISKGNKSYCANIAGGSVETEYDSNGNIVLADGIYDFYYKIHEDEIYIATATNCYTRDVDEGKYGTICLPKAATNCNGATFFEVAGKEGDKVFFDEVTTLEAGVPYIFLAEANKIVLSQTGESADEAGYSNSLQGTFSQIDPAVDNVLVGNYMVVNNVIKKCGANCGLAANRAYFIAGELETLGTPSALAPGRKRIAMGTTGAQVATGMENVDASAQPVKTIINGQLFILRGEKMYDAQGKLVK